MKTADGPNLVCQPQCADPYPGEYGLLKQKINKLPGILPLKDNRR